MEKDMSPSNVCAEMLHSLRNHDLRHVSYDIYSWKNRIRIWEELRPLKIEKINYGTSDAPFIIRRTKIPRRELRELSWELQEKILRK